MADGKNAAPAFVDAVVSVTAGEDTKSETCRFHTPTLLKKVEAAPDGSSVRIAVEDGDEPRVLVEGPKAKVAGELAKSVIPHDRVQEELRKFTQFLLDHSDLRVVGVHAVCLDAKENRDNGFGYVTTSPDCTQTEAVLFVNCGDANVDEFVAKAKLEVPGRGKAGDGPVIVP